MAIKVFVFVFLMLSFPNKQVHAQTEVINIPKDANWTLTGENQHASLLGWFNQSNMKLMDRTNSPYGWLTDRGWMYNYTNRMEDEYHLNLMSYQGTLSDDYLFYRSPNAVRLVSGDYNSTDLITLTELQFNVLLMPRHRIKVWSYMEQSPVLSRVYMNVEYSFEILKNFYVGVGHNLGPRESDLDISGFLQYGDEQKGFVKLGFVAADYLSNTVHINTKIPATMPDTIRRYSAQPYHLQLAAVSPLFKNFRAEIFANYQPFMAKSIIKSAIQPLDQYLYSYQNWFAGGLLEYKFNQFTIGLVSRYMDSFSRKDSLILNPKYANKQAEFQNGAYIIANASMVSWDTWFWMVNYYERQSGTQFLNLAEINRQFIQRERRIYMHNRIWVRPDYRGVMFGIEHLLDFRHKKVGLPSSLTKQGLITPNGYDPLGVAFPDSYFPNNNRIIFLLGFQFNPRARVQVGMGLDLDNDFHKSAIGDRYDNAFVRVEYRW